MRRKIETVLALVTVAVIAVCSFAHAGIQDGPDPMWWVLRDGQMTMNERCSTLTCEQVRTHRMALPIVYTIDSLWGVCDSLIDCAAHAEKVCRENMNGPAISSTLAADDGSTGGQACVFTCKDQTAYKALCVTTPRPPQMTSVLD